MDRPYYADYWYYAGLAQALLADFPPHNPAFAGHILSQYNFHLAPLAVLSLVMSPYKRWTGRVGNLIVQLLAVPGIWDTQCGFKAFHAEAAERIFSQAKIEGWGFDIEILALARAFNYKIGIIPARWVNDPRSNIRPFDQLRVLEDALRVRAKLRARRYRVCSELPGCRG